MVKRISERHHALARSLADGLSPAEAAISCGYCLSRVSILQQDTFFQELVSFYREKKDIAFKEVQEQLAVLASDTIQVLQTRLEEHSEEISTGDLVKIIGTTVPSQPAQQNVTINLSDRMREAQMRVING